MMKQLVEEGKRLAGKPASTRVEAVLHPGGRGERGFVTFFLYDKGQPFCLAKVARVDDDLLRREAANLEHVAAALADSSLRTSVDHALGSATIDGRLVLFKHRLAGRPLSQLLANDDHEVVLDGLRASTTWLLRFIDDTRAYQVKDPDAKRSAVERIVSANLDQGWVDTFVNSDHCVLGPAHGDLVPANILMGDGSVSGVVDFERYEEAGLPFADFVGLIVSTATIVFGRGPEMIDMTFGVGTWFSLGVAEQVRRYCAQTGCSLDEFIDVLPIYSDRALSIADEWNLGDEYNFHERLRRFLVSDRSALVACFEARA